MAKKITVDCWDDANEAITHSDRIILSGPPGSGKTYAALKYGLKKRDAYAVTLDSGTMVQEIRGSWVLLDGKMVWQDGPGVIAARTGSRLVINEIDRSSEDVLGFLYGLCDSKETALFTLPTGEVIQPANGFQVIATMNGDPATLPEGIQSRFPVQVFIDRIHGEALKTLPENLRTAAQASLAAEPERRVTIRQWQAYAQLLEKTGQDMALRLVFGARAGDIQDVITATTMRS